MENNELTQHLKFMDLAVELSKQNIETGNGGPFGAVIVKNGEVIAAEANSVIGTYDPTAHAEVSVIRAACQKLQVVTLEGCILYTSCEPCPMCASAIYWSKLDAVYYANTKADADEAGFGDAVVTSEIAKDLEDRSIPFKKILSEDALQAFKSWVEKYGNERRMSLSHITDVYK
jgi:guanine deaminase